MLRAKLVLLVALCGSSIGCTRGEAPKSSPVSAAELSVHLDRWCAEERGLLPAGPSGVTTVPWPDPVQPAAGIEADYVFHISSYDVWRNGEKTELWLEGIEAKPNGEPIRWAVAATTDTPTGRVVRITKGIADKLGAHGVLYFSNPGVEFAPPPDAARATADGARFYAAPIDQRSTLVSKLLAERVGDCEPFRDVMMRAGQTPASEQCEMLAANLPSALAGCPKADHWGVMSLLYLMLVPERTARAELAFELAAESGEGVLDLYYLDPHTGPSEPWPDASKRWFAVPPTGAIHFEGLEPDLHPGIPAWGEWRLAEDGGPTVELELGKPNLYTLRWTQPGSTEVIVGEGEWTVRVIEEQPKTIALVPASLDDFVTINHVVGTDELTMVGKLSDEVLTLKRID